MIRPSEGRMYDRRNLSVCDDAGFTACMLCYTSVVKCQGRQVRRDGLDGCHPVFSLHSRETKECSLVIFIQMKLELTASVFHSNKLLLFFFFRSEKFLPLTDIKAEENRSRTH